jgi:hypothetical protein
MNLQTSPGGEALGGDLRPSTGRAEAIHPPDRAVRRPRSGVLACGSAASGGRRGVLSGGVAV